MARTAIPAQVLPKNGILDDLAWTSGDAANDHEFENTGRERLLMRNEDAGAKTSTIVSVTDEHGRTGDITMNPAASDNISIAGPFKPSIWNQRATADLGNVHVDLADDTSVSFAVIRDA